MPNQKQTTAAAPLAERMRPKTLEEFSGQENLVGEQSFLRRAIAEDRVPSMIFWGPPGSGKTTLAKIVAAMTHAEFIELSATGTGVREVREVIERAEEWKRLGQRTILFIDEIHRWNKAQQDTLLPHVEHGTVTLIGATTENPSFEVNSALLSRARVFVLDRLSDTAITAILQRAIIDREHGLSHRKIRVTDDVLAMIARFANGDARAALNTLEAAAGQSSTITEKLAQEVLQRSHLLYDKTGEEHYNTISALHKSIRGGDANAAVYWVARMLEGGEDPLYVARRLMRAASEDIGLANATALVVANAAFDACHRLGMPECAIPLAQTAIYLARSPKSIDAYVAYQAAAKDVHAYGNLPVPIHLRNAPTTLMKELGYGKGYQYTPREDSTQQTYLPEKLIGREYVCVA